MEREPVRIWCVSWVRVEMRVCGDAEPLSAKVLVNFQSGRNHKGNVNRAASLQGSLRCDERLAVEKEEELWG